MKRLQWGLAVMVGLVVILLVFGMANQQTEIPKKIKAESYELVDDSGQPKGVWAYDNKQKKTRFYLTADTLPGVEGTKLRMIVHDRGSKILMEVGQEVDTRRMKISANQSGSGLRMYSDKAGFSSRVDLSALSSGASSLSLADKLGNTRVLVTTGDDSLPKSHTGIDLYDAKENAIWTVP